MEPKRLRPPSIVLALLGAAVALALGAAPGCAPDIPEDPEPALGVMQFDPTATPPRIPEPTIILYDPVTDRLDFSQAGLDVPADCAAQTMMPQAQCEFYQFLESLDGFPTVSGARAPASEPLDLATVTFPETLFVTNLKRAAPVVASDLVVGFDTAASYLTIDAKAGWDLGGLYVVAVQGYDDGVKTASGHEVVADYTVALLKEETPLTCGVTSAAEILTCEWAGLFTGDPREEIFANLSSLEQLREAYATQLGLWSIAEQGGVSKAEAAMVWAFPIQSASVAELVPTNPAMVPVKDGPSALRVHVKGSVDPATLSAAFPPVRTGTVALLNLTKLAAGNLGEAVPAFTPSYDAATGDIVLALDAGAVFDTSCEPLAQQCTYGIIMTDGITDAAGEPLAASPVTVFLRSRGKLFENGASQVGSLDAASAEQLEAGRAQLAQLIDNPLLGLQREHMVYLYAFEY